MSMAKVSTYRAPDAIIEQKTGQLGMEGHDSLDNYIIQAIGKEPFLSFSRPGESPVQWIQLLHALEQQGSGKRSSQVDHTVEENGRHQGNCNGISSFASESNGIKEPGNLMKSTTRVAKSSSEHMQTLKIPEAVVAFAQAAAKANGEREKYLPGWPLLSPSKLQLQKCDKCSREFCSPVNYRRHIRVHRRSLNVNKVSPKNRELLGVFWDKLSLDEAKELATIKDMCLEEVSGSSIIRALSSLMRKPGFSSLPQIYLKAGAILLDVVECRSEFPISSQELFSVLDDASEKTFLCGGTALSLQRFVFDGEVGKVAMEMKNLIACTSFLLEQKLVKAWLADKDAEALRCQQLLFEEEEAAQKRQAEILERKRMKKLRQKEQKMKEQIVNKPGSEEGLCDAGEGSSGSEETPSSMLPSESGLATTDFSPCSGHTALEDTQSSCMVFDEACYLENGDADQRLEYQVHKGSAQRQPTLLHRPVFRPIRYGLGGFHSQVAVMRPVVGQKHNGYKDARPTSVVNSQMVWTRKSRLGCEEEDMNCKEEKKTGHRSDGTENCKVLIGSISVTLRDCNGLQENDVSLRQNTDQESLDKDVSALGSVDQTSEKFHVDRQEDGILEMEQCDSRDADISESSDKSSVRVLPDQSCLADCGVDDGSSEKERDSPEAAELFAPKLFSSKVAVAFLSQRWREALSSDHVKLAVSSDSEASTIDDVDNREESCANVPDDGTSEGSSKEVPVQPIGCSGLGDLEENHDAGMGSMELTSTMIYKPKFRAKPEKSYTLKYIPKQSC